MPIALLERLPLPSLRSYVSVSLLLTSCAVYYAHHLAQHVAPLVDVPEPPPFLNSAAKSPAYAPDSDVSVDATAHQTWAKTSDGYFYDMVAVLIGEGWCVWALINMAYCCLILVGKLIQKIVFGKLRVSEQQHVKDKFLNFMFYKFIFIFGVMNVQNMDEVLLLCTWFSVLCMLHLLTQLCKDRFEYLSFSPTIPISLHVKVLVLLAAIQASCAFLLLLSIFVGYVYAGINIFAFMAAECILLMTKSMYVIVRYTIHLWDLNHEGVWENRAIYVYYTELVFELASLSIDFCHHLHMLLWGHIFLSMASLVICMQLRYLFHDFQRRIRRHKNYLRVVSSMEARFAMSTKEELEANNDDCAICWEGMETARKLPCGHLFHSACLRSWLEQDTSCPTCRMNLSDPTERTTRAPVAGDINGNEPHPDAQANDAQNQMTNHFFQFDASRYISWLPSFSVEVTHTQILGNGMDIALTPIHTSQLDNMARQVQEVFPTVTLSSVIDDLRMTHSVELTIENIIEGRVTIPPMGFPSRTNQSLLVTPAGSSNSPPGDAGVAPVGSGSVPVLPSQGVNLLPSFSGIVAAMDAGRDEGALNRRDSYDGLREAVRMEDNIPGMDEPLVGYGYRFSKSAEERESMLGQRKDQMLEQARRRFTSRQLSRTQSRDAQMEGLFGSQSSLQDVDSAIRFGSALALSGAESETSLGRRNIASSIRERAYLAAHRRMQHN